MLAVCILSQHTSPLPTSVSISLTPPDQGGDRVLSSFLFLEPSIGPATKLVSMADPPALSVLPSESNTPGKTDRVYTGPQGQWGCRG